VRESTEVAWIETHSPSFSARHEDGDSAAAGEVLERLERFRDELDGRFPVTPGEVAVVIHPGPWHLSLAHPWLPLARMMAAPASRRYFAGWFASGEIHVLAPAALERRASALPESREALGLSPMHEYAHLVVAANNPELPPPFNPRSFGRYLRWAWLCEGAATHFAGQTRLLRPAIARRLREGRRPSFPPATRDALVLGGTVFSLLEQGAGPEACITLASSLEREGPERAIERAFMRTCEEVERDWLEHLEGYRAGA
jgi:hypothetical protein